MERTQSGKQIHEFHAFANDYNTGSKITGDRIVVGDMKIKILRNNSEELKIMLEYSLPVNMEAVNPYPSVCRSFCPVDDEYSKRLGRRVSSYTCYLKPVVGSRPNLRVILRASDASVRTYSIPQENGRTFFLKYFKRSENYDGIYPSNQHGRDGPITLTCVPKYVPLLDEWLGAGQFLDYPVADPKGPKKIGFCPVEYSKRFGRYVSSYTGYLKPVLGLGLNLKVVLEAEGRKIIFRENQAVGAQFHSNVDGIPSDNVVYARKEVILSARAIETPAITMKSGIGPNHVLEAARVPIQSAFPIKLG
ncbi:unnamed protein product [Orchesella dallaii]|uniref:Glucose-methanol-choline oxidoreductase N-terminal domain-containing protein n=1 Tax=Orchesella dallaii TaxID=48710 RepID=A0ABP1R1C6_9HEXA